ncbi:MAG: acyl carrier protein [Lachnospiraceae bacterium]|nr:acyl carrier protein [Lachnospiraceae bacterium]
MNRDEVVSNILDYASMAYGRDVSELSEDTRIKEDLGGTSILLVSLVSNIENELDVMLSLSDAGACKTLGEIADRVIEEM